MRDTLSKVEKKLGEMRGYFLARWLPQPLANHAVGCTAAQSIIVQPSSTGGPCAVIRCFIQTLVLGYLQKALSSPGTCATTRPSGASRSCFRRTCPMVRPDLRHPRLACHPSTREPLHQAL